MRVRVCGRLPDANTFNDSLARHSTRGTCRLLIETDCQNTGTQPLNDSSLAGGPTYHDGHHQFPRIWCARIQAHWLCEGKLQLLCLLLFWGELGSSSDALQLSQQQHNHQ